MLFKSTQLWFSISFESISASLKSVFTYLGLPKEQDSRAAFSANITSCTTPDFLL